tara:strand:- start:650 stop:1114 length:465 start_codon:yes stop_codon:yes gene_type:complete
MWNWLFMDKVSSLEQHRNKKDIEVKANEFAANVLNMVEPVVYENSVLKTLLDLADKVCYFSGDIENYQSRNAELCEKYKPLSPAESQLYTAKNLNGIIRLIFDGEYIYDIYLSENIGTEYQTEIVRLLDIESYFNFMKAEIAQRKFNLAISEGM